MYMYICIENKYFNPNLLKFKHIEKTVWRHMDNSLNILKAHSYWLLG